MKLIKSFIRQLQARMIQVALLTALTLLFFYLFSTNFRFALLIQDIDPNFIIGFLTLIALLLSLIQGSKDKRYSYNLRLIDSIEDKGLKVIGKLLKIRNKSSTGIISASHCLKAIKDGAVFIDLNDSLSKKDIESDMELVVAYIDTYFPEQKESWGKLLEDLTDVSNLTNNILVNYQENLRDIHHPDFENKVLNDASANLVKADQLDKRIEKLTLDIREGIVGKINDSKKKLKNSFDFSL